MEIIDVAEKVDFSEPFRPRPLKIDPAYKVPLICMEPGQVIEPHPSGTGIFYVMSGKGVMTVDGEEVEIVAGNMIFVEKGAKRGIKAVERLTAFAVHIA